MKAVEVRTVTAGDLDLSSATGRMNARIIGAVAQKEAEQTKDRVRAAKKQAAEDGRYRDGRRPYQTTTLGCPLKSHASEPRVTR